MKSAERSRRGSLAEEASCIRISGANAHNLKHISVSVPTGKVTLVSGPSGSGKSSLLIDILAREAARRTEIALSAHGQAPTIHRAAVDHIEGLPPVFALSSTIPASSQASIAEYTGVADSLIAKVDKEGGRRCSVCGSAVHQIPMTERIRTLLNAPQDALLTLSCCATSEAVPRLLSMGFTRALANGGVTTLDSMTALPVGTEVIIDQVAIHHRNSEQRVRAALHLARGLGSNVLIARTTDRNASPNVVHASAQFLSDSPLCHGCGAVSVRIKAKEFKSCESSSPLSFLYHLGITLREFATSEIAELESLISKTRGPEHDSEIGELLGRARTLGLGHLALGRQLCTLSTGELQRVRLLKFLRAPASRSLLILDEPTSGLSVANQDAVLKAIAEVTQTGTTILIADHSPSVRKIADHEVVLGPGSGEEGGTLVYDGPIRPCRAPTNPQRTSAPLPECGTVEISHFSCHNIQDLTLSIPLGRLVVITGVSGSGKSTLVFHGIAHELEATSSATVRFESQDPLPRCLPLGRLKEERLSNAIVVGSYVHLLAPLRELFASLPLSRARGYSPSMFSPLSSSQEVSLDNATLDVRFKGYSIDDLLHSSVTRCRSILGGIPKCAHALDQLLRLNLGYLHLNQPVATLSSGERQRARLARSLAESRRKALFLFDEPSRGLDENEATNLASELHSLIRNGHSIIAIEHNPIFIDSADVVIELGPGAGAQGGRIIAITRRNY